MTNNEGKFTLDCFKILIKDLRDMQHDLDFNFQNEQFMHVMSLLTIGLIGLLKTFSRFRDNILSMIVSVTFS